MFLSKEEFSVVTASAPLISIDFVVLNSAKEVLLGKRLNPPAKDYWFVPGGRIRKNETLARAFKRLSSEELGADFGLSDAEFIGVHEHLYEESIFKEVLSTHYIVLVYKLVLEDNLPNLPLGVQHKEYIWMPQSSLKSKLHVHEYTKRYF